MKAFLNSLRRFALTGLVVAVALFAGYKLWDYYFEAPWTRDFLHQPLLIENGELVLPSAPGWGSEINEEAVRARPAKTS